MIKREIWGRTIRDFHQKELPELIERETRIDHEIPINRVISIIGPRRAGKTYLMFQTIRQLLKEIEKERVLYVNFESDLLYGCGREDLRNLIETYYEIYPENRKKKAYIFLDEIQNVKGWEIFVRSILDSEKAQVFISGSSSKLLSKEIATQLRGRTITYPVYPFSFREYLMAKKFKIKKYPSSYEKSRLMNLLRGYLFYGGYPEAVLYDKKILREIWDVTIYRDIVERHGIKNIKVLRLLIKSLKVSLYFSVHKFYNYLKSLGITVSKNTLYLYMQYLEDALILYPLRKYSPSYKEVEQSMPKIYLADNGLLSVEEYQSEGRLIENLVMMQLIRDGSKANSELFYYKSNDSEVDFIIKELKVKQLIQVTYASDKDEIEKREIKALIKASNELKCKNLLTITWDYEADIEAENKKIKCLPLWKWLEAREIRA